MCSSDLIIFNPYEWGRLDYLLAQHILNERGIDISDTAVQDIKNEKIAEMSQKILVSRTRIIVGYVLAFLFPMAAVIIGFTIKHNRIILPNGKKFYIHPETQRKHGANIINISIAMFSFCFLIFLYQRL